MSRAPAGAGGERPPAELDHLFVLVRPWLGGQSAATAADEIAAATVAAGFRQSFSRRHEGQGTENRRFEFERFMFELLFAVAPDELAHERGRPLALPARHEAADASPFGVASRPLGTARTGAPYVSVAYHPLYLPSGLHIDVAADVPVTDPLWFHLPFAASDEASRAADAFVPHPNGCRGPTGLTLAAPTPFDARSVAAAAALGIALERGPAHRATLTLDGARQGRRLEPHPRLPLTIDC